MASAARRSHPRPRRRHSRHVRFSLPLDTPPSQPSLHRAGTPRLREQPAFDPSLHHMASQGTLHPHHERLLRAQEALHDIRAFLEAACNFHGDEKRQAMSVLSVDSLCLLITHLNAVRGDHDAPATRRFIAVLRQFNLDLHARHPHEQISVPEHDLMPRHERNARRAQRRRKRREAEYRLHQFVSRQLHIPLDLLRELPAIQREQRELDAFKVRLTKFNVPRPPPGVVLRSAGGTNSVPQSPVERRYTEPRPSGTDPPADVRRAYEMGPDHELYSGMGELFLPDPVHPVSVHHPDPSAGYAHAPPPPPPHPAAGASPYAGPAPPPHHATGSSPYAGAAPSPYMSATTYTPPGSSSGYAAVPVSPGPPATPPNSRAQSPYSAGAYTPPQQAPFSPVPRPKTPGPYANSAHANVMAGYPRTPPRAPAGFPGAAYANHNHEAGYGQHPNAQVPYAETAADSAYMYDGPGGNAGHGGAVRGPYHMPRGY